jgi:hypothetical protein
MVMGRASAVRAFGLTAKILATLSAGIGAASIHDALAANGQSTALPILKACHRSTPQVLPDRWRAVGLMFPFDREQLVVGEFVYDAALPAMRATLYGLETGAVDLLITPTETYRIDGPPDSPVDCAALGHTYDPPGRQWVDSKATCDGQAPVGTKNVEWWKWAASDGRAQWQWNAADSGLPWRVMFSSPSREPAVIGEFGMTYFPAFTPIKETNLARLRDFCVAKSRKANAAEAAAKSVRELMTIGHDRPQAERDRFVQSLIPGLSRNACTRMAEPRWPNHFVMTGILSPVLAKWTPLPTMIYYDWDDTGTMFELLHEARTVPPTIEIVGILKKGIGYSIERLPDGAFACKAANPGAVRPDWMSVANCECKAVLDHNRDLDPGETSQIRACPVKGEGLHVNWAWYSAAGRPILFTEPGAIGMGLNIADYHDWLPGMKMPADSFALPLLCVRPQDAGLPPVGNGLPAAATSNCSDCHTTRQ